LAAAVAWCLRAAEAALARPSAEAQQGLRSARPEASAEPVTVLPSEAAAARYARPEAVAAESLAWAAAVARLWEPAAVRLWEAEGVLRAPAGAAAGQVGAAAPQQAAALGAAQLWAGVLPAAPAGEAARRQAVALDAVRQPAARPSVARPSVPPWIFHPDPRPWPAPPPVGRFARAMPVRRIAWP
jgi:hypothetical protein